MKYKIIENMKKLLEFFSLITFTFSLSAQENTLPVPLRLNEVNITAARYFNKNFKDVKFQTWYNTSIGNQVLYKENGIVNQTMFNQSGEFEYTIRFLEIKDLPQNISIKIAKSFPEFDLLSINELNLNDSIIYFIRLKLINTQKSFIVSEDEIQLYSDFNATKK